MTTNIFAFVVVLGILIFFHELGHFLVARLFGVGVEKFSLGFGPRLFGRTVGITDYRISAIPLGGYVKMVGDEPDAELAPELIPYSFTHKHVFKKNHDRGRRPVFQPAFGGHHLYRLFYFYRYRGYPPGRQACGQREPGGPGRACRPVTWSWPSTDRRWPPGATSIG
jgi:hypothetical protein